MRAILSAETSLAEVGAAMKAFVGVTDLGWYKSLAARSLAHDEVNFWFPSSTLGFRALVAGQPFIFKTHISHTAPSLSNRIVGVGLFSGFARLHASEAWKLFGEANGAESLEQLVRRIARYRREPLGRFEDPKIGCALLNTVRLLPEGATLDAPDDFANNIVRGRGYDIESLDDGHSVVEAVMAHWVSGHPIDSILRPDTRGGLTTRVGRIGQQAFQAVIGEKYGHRCAITGDKVRPVLQAAHILPVSKGGEHRVDNGLYLRSDVHTLFDAGYLGIDTRHRLRVSPALRARFGNGDWFYAHVGETIALPPARADRPAREFVEWHADEVFLAGDE